MEKLYIQLLDADAKIPTYPTLESAGLDCFAYKDHCVKSRSWLLIPLGFAVRLPDYSYGRLAARSGFALKNGMEVGAGVIDRDYTGEVGVLLHNHSGIDFHV